MNSYVLKREVLRRTGLTGFRWQNLRAGLYVFNYHRVGDALGTPFDPNVFSCDEAHFDKQVETIASRFRLTTFRELSDILASQAALTEPLALITFDDGYRDNFTKAFPILKQHGARAAFFLPTAYIGQGVVPWWDEIAWMMKSTAASKVQLFNADLSVDKTRIKESIRATLNAFKRDPAPIEDKLDAARCAFACRLAEGDAEALFMSWNDVREMRAAGMDIGSHTHSHRILAHLPENEQADELATSKAILEREIGKPITAIAYPVGGRATFTRETELLAFKSGYDMAFSFIAGYNPSLLEERFALRRMAVEENATTEDIKLLAVFGGIDPALIRRIGSLGRMLKGGVRRTRSAAQVWFS